MTTRLILKVRAKTSRKIAWSGGARDDRAVRVPAQVERRQQVEAGDRAAALLIAAQVARSPQTGSIADQRLLGRAGSGAAFRLRAVLVRIVRKPVSA